MLALRLCTTAIKRETGDTAKVSKSLRRQTGFNKAVNAAASSSDSTSSYFNVQ